MTTVFVVVIAASVVVVLEAYWPHRPGPTYINSGKISQSTQSLVSRYIPPNEVWNYLRTPKLYCLACLKSRTTAQKYLIIVLNFKEHWYI